MPSALLQFRVGVTDRAWFEYFRQRPALIEMNFWCPGTLNTRVEPGTVWVFLLKPNTIAGCAVVEVAYSLPLWLAWDAFGAANGSDTRDEFYEKISGYRKSGTTLETEIGCIGLTSPSFFDQPFDFEPYQATWTNRSQPTKRYDTGSPEGVALWKQIQQRLKPLHAISPGAAANSHAERLVRVRLGQGGFRTRVIESYLGGVQLRESAPCQPLKAAHIKPFTLVREHEVANGLLLRADIHKLFDLGYVTVRPDLKFQVSDALRQDYSNGRIYSTI